MCTVNRDNSSRTLSNWNSKITFAICTMWNNYCCSCFLSSVEFTAHQKSQKPTRPTLKRRIEINERKKNCHLSWICIKTHQHTHSHKQRFVYSTRFCRLIFCWYAYVCFRFKLFASFFQDILHLHIFMLYINVRYVYAPHFWTLANEQWNESNFVDFGTNRTERIKRQKEKKFNAPYI